MDAHRMLCGRLEGERVGARQECTSWKHSGWSLILKDEWISPSNEKGGKAVQADGRKPLWAKTQWHPKASFIVFLYFGEGDKYLSVAEIRSEKLEVTGGKDRERGRARALWAWYARLRPVDCLVGNKELYKKVGSRGGMWSILHFRWITPAAVVWGYCNVQARIRKPKGRGCSRRWLGCLCWYFLLS